MHRRDKRSPSVQGQDEIEKKRPGECHIAPGIHSARARGEDVKTVGSFPGSTSPTASLPSLLLLPHGQLQRVTLVSE